MQEPNARTANAVLGQPVDGTMETENRASSKTFCGGRLSGFCHRHRRYTVVLGGIFLYLPIGVPWYFGENASLVLFSIYCILALRIILLFHIFVWCVYYLLSLIIERLSEKEKDGERGEYTT